MYERVKRNGPGGTTHWPGDVLKLLVELSKSTTGIEESFRISSLFAVFYGMMDNPAILLFDNVTIFTDCVSRVITWLGVDKKYEQHLATLQKELRKRLKRHGEIKPLQLVIVGGLVAICRFQPAFSPMRPGCKIGNSILLSHDYLCWSGPFLFRCSGNDNNSPLQ